MADKIIILMKHMVIKMCKLKKLVYLISPNQITKNFYSKLDRVLCFGTTAFFQLRLKNISDRKIFLIAKKIRKITGKH